MKIIDKIKGGNYLSIEIEPPKIGSGLKNIFNVLDPLIELGIKHIDITYHPEQIIGHIKQNGDTFPLSQKKKPGTAGIAGAIIGRYKDRDIEPVPHMICTGFTKYHTEEYLTELAFLGVENVLALRGDPPKGPDRKFIPFKPMPGGHSHANELIEQITGLKESKYVGAKYGEPLDFCVGAACYPEKHSQSKSLDEDLYWTKIKVDSGADYLVTQMFLDNDLYFQFVEKATKKGIDVPIIPGIFPIYAKRHLEKLPEFFRCSIPKELINNIEKYESKEDIKKAGIEWCIKQCLELRDKGAPSLHFYANRKAPIKEVIESLKPEYSY